jgi:hypothetical protein
LAVLSEERRLLAGKLQRRLDWVFRKPL